MTPHPFPETPGVWGRLRELVRLLYTNPPSS
jgi:hypothetical protein